MYFGEFTTAIGSGFHADCILSHCNTCKKLSGGAYTLNQIVPSSDLKITKGENDLKIYEYAGASGMSAILFHHTSQRVSF